MYLSVSKKWTALFCVGLKTLLFLSELLCRSVRIVKQISYFNTC